jgi:hypothetical protein
LPTERVAAKTRPAAASSKPLDSICHTGSGKPAVGGGQTIRRIEMWM